MIVLPVVLLLIFGIAEGALYAHARNTLHRAASSAAVSAAAHGASNTQGQEAAANIMSQASDIRNPTVQIARSPYQVTVTIRATSPTILGALTRYSLVESAAAPIEQWR